MYRLFSKLTLVLAGTSLFLAVVILQATQTTTDSQGYDIKLSATSVSLMFPDGSEITAPLNFDGKNLDKLSATEGMARELLDEAYRQLGVEKSISLPKAYSLSQNSPNPFNPSTAIRFTVPDGPSLAVSLKVFDLRGKLIRTLADELKQAGTYQVIWNGTNDSGRQVSSGVYFYRMQAGEFVQTRKMVLVK